MDISSSPRPTSTLVRALHCGAAFLLIVAAPFAVVGLLGQDDFAGAPRSELDYVLEPPDISTGLLTAVGVIGLLVALAAAAFLLLEVRRGTADVRRGLVVLPLVAASMIVGYTYHAATEGVIGANIGYGILLLFGGPMVAALSILAVVSECVFCVRARRRTP